VKWTARLSSLRRTQPTSMKRPSNASPSDPARCERRSLQSRQVRQSGRRWPRSVARHAEIAGEVVVADPGLAQCGVLRPGPGAQKPTGCGKTHHAFEQQSDLVIRKREIAVAPLLALAHKTAGLEL
jgi:hypothetical protein